MQKAIKWVQVGVPYDESSANEMKDAIEEFWKTHGIVVRVDLRVVPLPGRPQLVDVRFDVFRQ